MKKVTLNILSVAGLSVFLLLAAASKDDNKSSNSNSSNSGSSETTTKEKPKKKPDLEIVKESSTYEQYTNSYTIHCRVRNNTDHLIDYFDITATFYDKQKNIVGTGLGNCVNLAAGAEKTVDVIGLDINGASTYEVEIGTVM